MNESIDFDFAGKVALVTGSYSGIGLATSKLLEDRGARVIRVDIQEENQAPWRYSVDLSQPKSIDSMMSSICSSLGEIDFLVHAAGILKTGMLLEYSLEDWQNTFALNTLGSFYLCQQVGQHMATRKQGAMVVVGSNCANTPRLHIGAYAASKAALHQMLKCLGLELSAFGVRCNIVAPGSTDTAMQRMLWQSPEDVDRVIAGNANEFRLGIPLKKIADPQDIASSICFLLSQQAKHITLETLTVDGGATLGCSH